MQNSSKFNPNDFSSEVILFERYKKQFEDRPDIQLHLLDKTNDVIKIDIKRVLINTKILCIVYIRKFDPKVCLWGFVKLDKLSIVKDTYVIKKNDVVYYIPRNSLNVHESFSFYSSDAPTSEMSLNELEIVWFRRLNILKDAWLFSKRKSKTETWSEELSTEEDIQADFISYLGIISSIISCNSFESRADLFRIWKQLEENLTKLRCKFASATTLLQSPVNKMVRVHKDVSKCPDLYLKRFLMEWLPNQITFYSMPFEKATKMMRTLKCFLHKGDAYFTENEMGILVEEDTIKHQNETFERALNWSRSIYFTREKRMIPYMKKVVTDMYILKDIVDGSVTNSTGFPKMPIGKLLNIAPRCIQMLHEKASDLKNPKYHLKNDDRTLYARFLLMCSWTESAIANYWKPKINISYDNSESATKEILQTIKWASKRLNEHGIQCSYLMNKGQCPWSNDLGSGVEGGKACSEHLQSKMNKRKLLSNSMDVETNPFHVFSPMHYTKIALSKM